MTISGAVAAFLTALAIFWLIGMITGDSLFNWRSRMRYSIKLFCTDVKLSVATADRLGEADYAVAAFTHGPEIREGARDAIRDFLRRSR